MREIKHIPELTESDLKRFWSKVQRLGEDDCWPWLAGKDDGYGVFGISRNNKETKYRAPRIALYTKDQNEQEVARHKCDNPICCNPRHLEWGTHQDNVDDMISRNRNTNKGVEVNTAKLKESDVIEIRRLYADGEYNIASIARRYPQVSRPCISQIINRVTWAHII